MLTCAIYLTACILTSKSKASCSKVKTFGLNLGAEGCPLSSPPKNGSFFGMLHSWVRVSVSVSVSVPVPVPVSVSVPVPVSLSVVVFLFVSVFVFVCIRVLVLSRIFVACIYNA